MESHTLRSKGNQKQNISQKHILENRVNAKILRVEEVEISTVDGGIVSQSVRSAAMKKGAGLMIGDYFVGVTTGADFLFSQPLVVY